MAECFSCGAERGRSSFCTVCSKVQPITKGTTYFEILGLEPRMALSRADLEKAFLETSRRVHPDRFSREAPVERKLALEQTTFVNEGYRALRNRRQRAAYLFELQGHSVGGEAARVDDPDFLMEMMTLRETLEEARDPDVVESLQASVEARTDTLFAELERYFDRGEGEVDTARIQLQTLRFLERFLEEVDRKLEVY